MRVKAFAAFCLTLLFAALCATAGDPARAQGSRRRGQTPAPQAGSQQPERPKQVIIGRGADNQRGSRMTITSDEALNDYSAYRSGDRFYVELPNADAATAARAAGKGFSDMQVTRRGKNVVLSYRVQPGAKPRVEQRFNRLEVIFEVPPDGTAPQQAQAAQSTATTNPGAAPATRNDAQPQPTAQTPPAARTPETAAAPQTAPTQPPTSANAAAAALAAAQQPPTTQPGAQVEPTPSAPASTEAAPAAPQEVAQAQQPAPVAPATTNNAAAQPGSGTSVGAFLLRNWVVVLVGALLLAGMGLLIASRRTATAAPPPPAALKESPKESPKAALKQSPAVSLDEARAATPAAAVVTNDVKEAKDAAVAPKDAAVNVKDAAVAAPLVAATTAAALKGTPKKESKKAKKARKAREVREAAKTPAVAPVAQSAVAEVAETAKTTPAAETTEAAAAEPAAVEPVAVEPAAVENAAVENAAVEAAAVESVVAEPAGVAPVAAESAGVEPVGVEPVGVEPVEVESVDVEPVVASTAAAEPAAVEAPVEAGATEVTSEVSPAVSAPVEAAVATPAAAEPEVAETLAAAPAEEKGITFEEKGLASFAPVPVLSAEPAAAAEPPTSVEPFVAVDPDRAHAETLLLLDGAEYDRAVLSTRDAMARQMVGAELLSALAGRNAERRARAHAAFKEFGYFDEKVEDLRTAEASAERSAAARALGLAEDRAATPHLIDALEDDAVEVRRAAVESLAALRDPSAVEALEALMLREKQSKAKVNRKLVEHAVETCRVGAATSPFVASAPAATPAEPAVESVAQVAEAEPAAEAAPAAEAMEEVAAPEVTAPAAVEVAGPAAEEVGEETLVAESAVAQPAEPAVTEPAEAPAVSEASPAVAEEREAGAEPAAFGLFTPPVAEPSAPASEETPEPAVGETVEAEETVEVQAPVAFTEPAAVEEPAASEEAFTAGPATVSEEVSEPEPPSEWVELDISGLSAPAATESTEAPVFETSAGEAVGPAEPSTPAPHALPAPHAFEPTATEATAFDSTALDSTEVESAAVEPAFTAFEQTAPAFESVGPAEVAEPVSESVEVAVEPFAAAIEPAAPPAAEPPPAVHFFDAGPAAETPAPPAGEEKGVALFDEHSSVPANIQQRLSSREPAERAAAVAELARVDTSEAFQQICAAFDDEARDVRSAAARALYDVPADRADTFTRALREASSERRRNIGAAIATSGLASDAISQLTGESREKTYEAFSLLFLMAKAGEVAPLVRAIEGHPNNEVRLAVVKLLALSGQKEILPAFRRLAVRGSLPTEVRSAVMEAIYQISSQSETTPATRNYFGESNTCPPSRRRGSWASTSRTFRGTSTGPR